MMVTVIPIVVGGFGTISKWLEKDWKNWTSEEESRSYKPQHCWDRLEYWDESWKPEETCRYLDVKSHEHKKLARSIIKIDRDTNCNWCARNDPQRLTKGAEKVENWGMSRDHPKYRISEIGLNTEKSPGDIWKLAVTPVFVARSTKRTSVAQGLLRWVRRQDRCPDSAGIPQNASGPISIPLKRGASGARR